MSVTGPTEEVFLKDVEQHEVKVLMDNGVYRHLKCKQAGTSNAWFDIVTWPWFLAYSGDMGSFVFSRLDDMFQFFRAVRGKDGSLTINRSYWGEKLEAVDRDGRASSHRQFSEDKLCREVEERVKTWIEEFEAPCDSDEEEEAQARKTFETELRQAIEEDVYYHFGDSEHEAWKAINDFSFKQEDRRFSRDNPSYQFQDTWEWNCEDYTYRFTWCCYALAWAIEKYDALLPTSPEKEQTGEEG